MLQNNCKNLQQNKSETLSTFVQPKCLFPKDMNPGPAVTKISNPSTQSSPQILKR